MRKKLVFLAVLVLAVAGFAIAQQGVLQTPYGAHDAYNRTIVAGDFISYSPTQLGANAITLPASGTTAQTNIIDTRGVRQATLSVGCTQPVTGNFWYYDTDGVSLVQTLQITGTSQYPIASIGSESSVQTPTPGVAPQFHFPFRAISFTWTNTTATPGTCTARLFLAY